jgi:hypothetical protein
MCGSAGSNQQQEQQSSWPDVLVWYLKQVALSQSSHSYVTRVESNLDEGGLDPEGLTSRAHGSTSPGADQLSAARAELPFRDAEGGLRVMASLFLCTLITRSQIACTQLTEW